MSVTADVDISYQRMPGIDEGNVFRVVCFVLNFLFRRSLSSLLLLLPADDSPPRDQRIVNTAGGYGKSRFPFLISKILY